MADDADPSEPIRFRTTKKRKAYRQRAPQDDDTTISNNSTTTSNGNGISAPDPIPTAAPRAPSIPRSFGAQDLHDEERPADQTQGPADDDHDDPEPPAAAALRLRTSHRSARLRGMGFKSDAQQQQQTRGDSPAPSSSQALVPRDQGPDAAHDAAGVDSRFMHQTGLLTILDDVHMNEFIEARLASRNARHAAHTTKPHPTRPSPSPSSDDDDDRDRNNNNIPANPRPPLAGIHSRAKDHQPARHGKLFEVAIPDAVRKDAKDRDRDRDRDKDGDKNRRDGAKRRRLHDPAGKDREARKAGRSSDDIQRDAMVEQFLHENRLDVYDTAEASSSSAPSSRYAPGKDFSADARLAEQFRRQYYEDLALRRKKRRPALSKKEQQQQRAAQATEVLKGPKLGGSRNQRAAIRNILLQQQGEKKG